MFFTCSIKSWFKKRSQFKCKEPDSFLQLKKKSSMKDESPEVRRWGFILFWVMSFLLQLYLILYLNASHPYNVASKWFFNLLWEISVKSLIENF